VECIPEEGDFQLQLPVQGSTAGQGQAFTEAWALGPQALSAPAQAKVLPASQPAADGRTPEERVQLRIEGLPEALQGRTLDFYPESSDTFHHAAELGKDWQQRWDGAAWVAELPLSDMRGETPAKLPVVLALPPAERAAALEQGQPVAWRAEAPVEGRWTAAAMASVSPALAAALAANQAAAPAASATSLWMALLGGLLGGLIPI
jgi:thiol:disulfide interchange protein DsbD